MLTKREGKEIQDLSYDWNKMVQQICREAIFIKREGK